MIKVEDTRSLSAIGSITLPKLETSPLRLAKKPSRKSVMAAILKSKAAVKALSRFGNSNKITITGTAAMRNRVRVLG